jgi:hypothetical protein
MDDEFLAADASEALLIGILPLFTTTHRQDNSAKSSYFENFCTLFSAEAVLLETWLIDQNSQIYKSSETYLEILDNILSLFESLVSDQVLVSLSSARPLVCSFNLPQDMLEKVGGDTNSSSSIFATLYIPNFLLCTNILHPRTTIANLYQPSPHFSRLVIGRPTFERSFGS